MPNKKSHIPSQALADAARRMALELGLAPTCQALSVSHTALAAVCGRLPGHLATHRWLGSQLGVPVEDGK
ncbi:MAG TPA: hypothetical protein VKP30_12595 [Polyangiaceae bacterium]|nr:hypothetical protein [Polyangiaceae bacterium]